MSESVFGAPTRGDRGQPWDLRQRIEAEMAARIEEAVDFACLEAMVEHRRSRDLPAPQPDSATDRDEFNAGVLAFLERLRARLGPGLPDDRRGRLEEAAARPGEPAQRLVAVQVVLARELPDYWERFEVVRGEYRTEVLAAGAPSGGERRGLLRRILGH